MVTKNNEQVTKLLEAAKAGEMDTVKEMIDDTGYNVRQSDGYTPLMHAAWGGNQKVTAFLLIKSTQSVVNAQQIYGWTATMFAAYEGHTDALKTLIQAGAKVNLKCKDGRTV